MSHMHRMHACACMRMHIHACVRTTFDQTGMTSLLRTLRYVTSHCVGTQGISVVRPASSCRACELVSIQQTV